MRIKVEHVWRQTYGDGQTTYGLQLAKPIPLVGSASLVNATSPVWTRPEDCDTAVDSEYIYKNTYIVIDPDGEIGLIFNNDEDRKQFFGK